MLESLNEKERIFVLWKAFAKRSRCKTSECRSTFPYHERPTMEVENDVSPLIGGRIIHVWVPDASDNDRLDASVCEYATVEVICLRRDSDEAFFLGCWFQTQRCAYFHDEGMVEKRFHQLVHNGLVVCPFRVLA